MDAITPITAAQTALAEQQARKDSYGMRVLVGFDTLVNVIAGGSPDETISTRAARDDRHNLLFGKLMSDFLDHFQADHGAEAAAGDYARAVDEAQQVEESGIIKENQ